MSIFLLYEYVGKTCCGFVCFFVVTGGRIGASRTPNLEVFKIEQENFLSLSQ